MTFLAARIVGMCAIALGCAAAPGALLASISEGADKLEGYVALEGTRASALVPAGWSCNSVSASRSGKEHVSVLSCVVTAGSSSMIGIQKMFDDEYPESLQSYLQQALSRQPKGLPGDAMPLMPQMIQVGGRNAVEFASAGKIYLHGGQGDTAFHRIVFEHASTYYACSLQTSLADYTAALRKTLTQFCASIRFDNANPSSGKH